MTEQQQKIGLIGALALISLVILAPTFFKGSLPTSWPGREIKKGLDIKGGIYLVLGVQTEEAVKSRLATIASALRSELREKNIGITRARQTGERGLEIALLNARSVDTIDEHIRQNYPELTRSGLTGSGQAGSGSEQGGGPAKLSYEINLQHALEIERQSVDRAIETIRNRVDMYGVSEPTIQRSGEKQIIVQLPDVKDVENVKKTIGSVAKLEFRMVADPDQPAGTSVNLRNREGGQLRLEDEALMTGDAVENANVDINPQTNEVAVLMKLTGTGARTFDRITGDNVGRQLAIILDNVVQVAPTIRDRISNGSAEITGNFSSKEAHRVAIVLRSGALPAPLTFEEERTVGASLGADAIYRGLVSALIGACLVVTFMLVYYKRSGLVAVGCLALNMIYLLATLSLFGATLTLPGIAGLALTVGMAVDANIIIFERIREELRKGAAYRPAIEAGFERAYSSIIDANVTTLITGIVLYAFGSGPIKGFAVTISIGVFTTVFAAVFISHVAFSLFDLRDQKGKFSI